MGLGRQIHIDGDVAFVELDKGLVATIDAADVPLVEPFTWHAAVLGRRTYARTGVKKDGRWKILDMRQILLGDVGGKRIFLTAGDLDYRRANLRVGAIPPIAVAPPHKKGAKRPIRIEGDVAYVPLSRGLEAVVDAEDAPVVAPYTWSALVSGGRAYAVTNIDGRAVFMRHLFAKPAKGRRVKSGPDPLDCRKATLGISGSLTEVRQRRNRVSATGRRPAGRLRHKVELTPRNAEYELAKVA